VSEVRVPILIDLPEAAAELAVVVAEVVAALVVALVVVAVGAAVVVAPAAAAVVAVLDELSLPQAATNSRAAAEVIPHLVRLLIICIPHVRVPVERRPRMRNARPRTVARLSPPPSTVPHIGTHVDRPFA
jgi:hypothetical protein